MGDEVCESKIKNIYTHLETILQMFIFALLYNELYAQKLYFFICLNLYLDNSKAENCFSGSLKSIQYLSHFPDHLRNLEIESTALHWFYCEKDFRSFCLKRFCSLKWKMLHYMVPC